MSNKEFADHLFLDVDKAVRDPRKLKEFIRAIHKWFDHNSEIILDTGMHIKPVFTPKDNDIAFSILDIDKDKVDKAVQASDTVKGYREKIFTNPAYIGLTLVARSLTKMKKTKEARMVYLYLAFRYYNVRYDVYFIYPPQRTIMDYTVNNLSLKFDIRRLGSLGAAMEKLADKNHETYEKGLISSSDDKILQYAESLRIRVNGFIQYFFAEFKKNWQEGNYLNVDSDESINDDENGPTRERTSDSTAISSAANAYHIWFISNEVNDKVLNFVSRESKISPNALRTVLEKIRAEKGEHVEVIAGNLLQQLVERTRDPQMKGVLSKKWTPFVLSQFSKTNTDDSSILEMKAKLDELLNEYCVKFAATAREATRSAYRRALLLYIAYTMQVQRSGNG